MKEVLIILVLLTWFVLNFKNIKLSFLLLVFLTLTIQPLFIFFDSLFATDFLWFSFLIVFFIKYRIRIYKKTINIYTALGLFFIFLYTITPFVGFLLRNDMNISLIDSVSPSLRFIQCVTYGFFALYIGLNEFSIRGSVNKWLKQVVVTVLLSITVHTIYAFYQYAAFFGLLSYGDLPHLKFYEGRESWFYWWRATGLLANPNTFGILSFFCSVSTLLLLLWKEIQGYGCWLLYLLSVIGVILSGSRTAIVSLVLISVICIFIGSMHKKIININIKGPAFLTFVALPIVIIIINSSDKLRIRFAEIINLLGNWDKIENLTGRFNFWDHAIHLLRTDTQFIGTLVSPYRIYESISTDNGYVALLLQFPLLSLLFTLWMIGGLIFSLLQFKLNPLGTTFFAITILSLFIVNMTLNLMIEFVLLIVFFVLNGVALSSILFRKNSIERTIY